MTSCDECGSERPPNSVKRASDTARWLLAWTSKQIVAGRGYEQRRLAEETERAEQDRLVADAEAR